MVVDCKGCGSSFNASERYAGLRVKCPHCSAPVRVPAAAPRQEVRPPEPSAAHRQDPIAPKQPAAQEWQSVRCPGCGHRADFRPEAAGKRVRCKRCSQVFRIKSDSSAADRSRKRVAPSPAASTSRPRAAEERGSATARAAARVEPTISAPQRPRDDFLSALEDGDGQATFDLSLPSGPLAPAARLPANGRLRSSRRSGSTEFVDQVLGIVAVVYALVAVCVLAYAYLQGGLGHVLNVMVPITNIAFLACYFFSLVRMARNGSLTLALFFAAAFSLYFVGIGFALAGRGATQPSLLLVLGAILILISIFSALAALVVCARNAGRWNLERVVPLWSLAFVLGFGSGIGRIVYTYEAKSGGGFATKNRSDAVAGQSPGIPNAPTAGEQALAPRPPAPTAPPQAAVPGVPTATPGPASAAPGFAKDEETLGMLQKLVASGESLRNMLRSIVDKPSAQRVLPELTAKEHEHNTLALQTMGHQVSAANEQKAREYGNRLKIISAEIKQEVARIRQLAAHERAVERAQNRAAIQERLHRRPSTAPVQPPRTRIPNR